MTLAGLKTAINYKLRNYGYVEWEEPEITFLINEGYNEFNNMTHCLRKRGQIIIVPDTSLYAVPSDNIVITRATWDGTPLVVRTVAEIDSIYETNWRATESTQLRAIMQDSEGYGYVRTYPIITSQNNIGHLVAGTDSNNYRCILNHTSASSNKPITGDDYATYWEAYSRAGTWANDTLYGVGDVVVGTDSKDYKCIVAHTSATATNKPITGSAYSTYWEVITGTWATATDYYKYLELELDYVYKPTDLSVSTDSPSIPAQYHQALVHYVVSQSKTDEVQSNQSSGWASIHWNRFIQYVRRCKNEMGRGIIAGKNDRIIPQKFI